MVQLKEFDQHIDEKKCFENVTRKVVRSIVYRGPLDSNGSEKLELKYGLNCSQRHSNLKGGGYFFGPKIKK